MLAHIGWAGGGCAVGFAGGDAGSFAIFEKS